MRSDIGVDGLKTGYTSSSGFGIIVSSSKDDKRLIGVVTGLDSVEERTSEITRLINYGVFPEFLKTISYISHKITTFSTINNSVVK